MPIIDSRAKKIIKNPDMQELDCITKKIRSHAMIGISAAGSGHTGGSMSIVDIITILYFKILRHDPKNPYWDERDRVFWSAGHKAPALYAVLGAAGYFNIGEIVKLRKLNSGFEGHPNRFKLPGIELSSGSLGQGLGVAVGSAINAKIKNKKYKVFCILGDGELDEGSVWEAAMSASHYKLDNLIAIVDRNGLQIDGKTSEVMEIEPLEKKWQAFGWEVIECNGHDLQDISEAFNEANTKKGKPTVIIANTVKGKCISFAENICGYHGIAPKDGITGQESLMKALNDISCPAVNMKIAEKLLKKANDYQKKMNNYVEDLVPKFSRDYFWNQDRDMKVEMVPNRLGFGNGIEKAGEDPKVVALGADITGSIKISSFYENHPERKARFFSMGIAEQNITAVAAGLAKEGLIPFIGSYGVFITGRNWDQIRTTVCYNKYNVKIVDAHGGISVGPDGATHQALEDISNLYYLPNMSVVVPVDTIEAEKATLAVKDIAGPAAIRIAREATPVVTAKNTPYDFGIANIYRYRDKEEKFADAFDVYLSTEYKSENEDLTIIGCGPVLAEALRAAFILKEEYGIQVRVINVHTVKPMDKKAVISAARDTKRIITCEEHQTGGFGNIVAGIISQNKKISDPFIMDMVGINDKFGQSGKPWELMKLFGLTAEFIALRAKKLMEN